MKLFKAHVTFFNQAALDLHNVTKIDQGANQTFRFQRCDAGETLIPADQVRQITTIPQIPAPQEGETE